MKKTNESGITLIALIITIILLIILGAVTFNAIKDDSIIDKAVEAVNKFEQQENAIGNVRSEIIDQL